MSGAGIAGMIVVCGLVWGGFAAVLAAIVRIERRKRERDG